MAYKFPSSLESYQPLQLLPVEPNHYLLTADDSNRRGHSPNPLQLSKSLLVLSDVSGDELYALLTEELLRPSAEQSARLNVQNHVFPIHRSSLRITSIPEYYTNYQMKREVR
jgi:hypothetical protein